MKKYSKYIILITILFIINEVLAQTGSGLDTLTKVNGWRLVEFAPGVTFAKTWFSSVEPYHGKYSQFFEVDRLSPNVADDRVYYAIFKKILNRRLKKSNYLQYSFNYSHSVPNLGIEYPLMDIAFGNNGSISNFRNIINFKRDMWTTYQIQTPGSFDSTDCVYLRISGNFKNTVIQLDYLTFIDGGSLQVINVLEDFEDSTITDVENEFVIPNTYSLSQNCPNPFNPTTKIKYTVSKTSFIHLIVYDVIGREIETLVNQEKQPGNYEVEFNANRLSSGIYYYKLQTDNYLSTKKMIYLK